MTTWIILAVAAVAAVAVIAIFNRLVALRNRWRNAWSQIDVQLKRRYDLIPNMVEAARAYMAHERQTLEAVIAARNEAARASDQAAAHPESPALIGGVIGAESVLTGQMTRFLARVEAYPELKASQTMARLMEELASTENRVAFARQAYNDAVMRYNTARETFPSVLVAGPLGFGPARLFEIDTAVERGVPQVSMSNPIT